MKAAGPRRSATRAATAPARRRNCPKARCSKAVARTITSARRDNSHPRRRAQDRREHGSKPSVPTATSQWRIPVKLLDENRRIINRHLQENDRRKASYTHLIAYAILRAIDRLPQLNDGFEVIDKQPSRVRRESVNLGIAIDVERKTGPAPCWSPILRTPTSFASQNSWQLTTTWSRAPAQASCRFQTFRARRCL